MSAISVTKRSYVRLAQGMGRLLDFSGAMALLEQRSAVSRKAHWFRSLFSIHSLDGLVELDVPWWSYDAIEEVTRILEAKPDARVFEYGSGASTVWLARRAGSVVSIEHHAGWHAQVQAHLDMMASLAPVDLRLVEPSATADENELYNSVKSGESGQSFASYASAIEDCQDEPFDVIVIDGRVRSACLKHAISALAPDGVIVFDNSHRKRYRDAIKASGLDAHCFRGMTPALPYPDETTLLYRRKDT